MDDDVSGRLSDVAREALSDVGNELYLSVASLWEMQIKASLGKLALGRPLKEIISDQRHSNGLKVLAVRSRHVFAMDWLEEHRRDPFDRLLVAQAMRDGLTLVTADPRIARYRVPTLW